MREYGKNPQGGMYAYVRDKGRAWIESVNSLQGIALVRFDANIGRRSRVYKVNLCDIDFTREWRF